MGKSLVSCFFETQCITPHLCSDTCVTAYYTRHLEEQWYVSNSLQCETETQHTAMA